MQNPSAVAEGSICSLIQSINQSDYLLLFLRTMPAVATAAAARAAGTTATATPVSGLTGLSGSLGVSPEDSPGLTGSGTSPEDSPGLTGSSGVLLSTTILTLSIAIVGMSVASSSAARSVQTAMNSAAAILLAKVSSTSYVPLPVTSTTVPSALAFFSLPSPQY